ncbi:MAG TPA: DNA recombination protein RmuC [Patescibacteria group bacterium]|nr:DNA recombination protein RmuC [Patescibacteria group bacterium]
MQDLLPLLIILLLGFTGIIIFLSFKLNKLTKQTADPNLLEWLKSMQVSLESTNRTLNQAMQQNSTQMVQTLQENSKQLNERLDKAAQVIAGVGREVGQMSEIGRNMKELQEFLKSPKMRGNIGEEILKDLIAQLFPKNSFHLQYQFKSGERVDAAIKTDAGILPIDSKFPMENYQKMLKTEDTKEKEDAQKEFVRDIKRHIDTIAKKYILPDEGTMDFALMYVPSESVFYELCNMTDMLEYARKHRVYMVSPSTLYVHLQTILLSFEGKKIESRSKEVFRLLRTIQIEYDKVNDNMGILGKHLGNASAQFANVTTGFSQLGNKLTATQTLEEKVVEEAKQTTLLDNYSNSK